MVQQGPPNLAQISNSTPKGWRQSSPPGLPPYPPQPYVFSHIPYQRFLGLPFPVWRPRNCVEVSGSQASCLAQVN